MNNRRGLKNKEDIDKKKNFKRKDWIDTKNNIKKSFRFVKQNKKELFVTILVSVICMPLSLLTPILSAKLLLNLNGELYGDLLKVAAFIMITYVVEDLLRFFTRIAYRKYTINVTYGIQKELMNETFNLKVKCFDENGTGIFADRLRRDTSNIVGIFESVANYIIEVLTNVGILVVVFSISNIMFIYFVIGGIISLFIEKIRTNMYYKRTSEIWELEEQNTGLVTELIRGVRDVKVLNANDVFMKKFDKRVNDVNDRNIALTIENSRIMLVSNVVENVYDFCFYLLGVILITNELFLASNFVVLYMYKSRIKSFFTYLSYIIDQIKSFNLSANRVFEIIDGKVYSKEKFGKKKMDRIEGNFEFRNVSFGYNDNKEVLHNVSFKVHANETVAFVGKSGSGKTTVFSLLNKLYDVEDGHIFIDGNDINSLTKDSIRNNMSIITQNPYIFNLSIRDNLLLVKDNVSEPEMIEACKIACLHDFIMTLPDGYDTIVGEGGVTLSGGERQRLAIARALIKDTEIILFDEATSALDNETQEKIQKAIYNLKGKYTILIIAHRLSTIINSDKIIMIEDGKVIATGRHEELMKESKKYLDLYQADVIE